jgi:hypothetical protein
MTGTLPSQIGLLTAMTELRIYTNGLYGMFIILK